MEEKQFKTTGNRLNESVWSIFLCEIPQRSLAKGQYIPPEIVERATATARSEYSFRFRTMELRSRIEDHFAEQGITVTVKGENDGLRILTDAEAAEYNAELFKQRLKASFTAHRKMMGVDTAMLSEPQKEAHDRRIVQQSRILQSISKVNKEVKLLPYRREL